MCVDARIHIIYGKNVATGCYMAVISIFKDFCNSQVGGETDRKTYRKKQHIALHSVDIFKRFIDFSICCVHFAPALSALFQSKNRYIKAFQI